MGSYANIAQGSSGTYRQIAEQERKPKALTPEERRKAQRRPGYLERTVGGAMSGAWENLVEGVKEDYAASKEQLRRGPILDPAEMIRETDADLGRKGKHIVNAVGTILSPVTGLTEALVVKPYGAVAHAVIPGYAEEDAKEDMRTALMAVRPARAGPPRPPRGRPPPPPPPARLNMADRVGQFDQAHVRPTMAAVGGEGSASVTKMIAENPIAGVRVRRHLRNSIDDTANAADRVAGEYGTPLPTTTAGETMQAGVTRFARDAGAPNTFAARSGRLYDTAWQQIPDGPVPAGETAQALAQIRGRVQTPELAAEITDPRIDRYTGILNANNGRLPFGDLRQFRTFVREAQRNPELRQGMAAADLQRLEAALTQDIRAGAVTLGGPRAGAALRRADQHYRAGMARIEDNLRRVFDAPSGEAAYDLLIRSAGSKGGADYRRVLALKRSLPRDLWGDVASTVIDRLGRPTPGAVGPDGDAAFSISRFVTNYNTLDARGRDVLFGSVGGGGARASALQRELDNLAAVAARQKEVERAANSSKSAVAGQSLVTVAGLVNPKTALPTAGFLSGMAVTGEMMSNPVVVRALAGLARAGGQSRAALAAQVRVLGQQAARNAALVPLHQQAQALIAAGPPRIATPLPAEEASEETPPPNTGPGY